MRRKFSKLGIVVILMMFAFALPCNAAQTVKVINHGSQLSVEVNGSQVNFDQPPSILNGRTMVPFRAIAEALGAAVDWDSSTNKVTITGDKKVELIIGSTKAMVDGKDVTLDTPAVVVGGRTMVPLRFVGEALGADVTYIPPAVQPAQQTSSMGLLPDEEKIQKSLTQEDFDRLRSYKVQGEKVKKDLATYASPEEAATFGFRFDTFNPARRQPIFDTAILLNNCCTFDYTKFASQDYTNKYIENNLKTGTGTAANLANLKKYISDKVASKLQIKTYLLTDKNLVYQASPTYTAIRVMYIFYQSNGTKIEEPGSSIGKWYEQDIELLFVTPLDARSGNTTGLIYAGMQPLSAPQPYFE